MKSSVRTQFNYDFQEAMTVIDPNEKIDVPVQPDQAWSIAELLARHQAGMLTDVDVYREPLYPGGDEDPDFDDVDLEKAWKGDLVDQAEFMEKTVREGRQANEAIRKAQEKANEKFSPNPTETPQKPKTAAGPVSEPEPGRKGALE